MSFPPDEDGPPGLEGPRLFDANEHRDTVNPPEPFSEPPTRPDIKSPLPQKQPLETRQTLRLTAEQREDIERRVYAEEHKRLATALELITQTLPTLATKAELEFLKEKLEAFDAGIRGNAAVTEAVGEQVSRLGNDIRIWLFGDQDGKRLGIAQAIDGLREGVGGALQAAREAKEQATGANQAAQLAADAALKALSKNGLDHEARSELAAASGSGRPDRG